MVQMIHQYGNLKEAFNDLNEEQRNQYFTEQ